MSKPDRIEPPTMLMKMDERTLAVMLAAATLLKAVLHEKTGKELDELQDSLHCDYAKAGFDSALRVLSQSSMADPEMYEQVVEKFGQAACLWLNVAAGSWWQRKVDQPGEEQDWEDEDGDVQLPETPKRPTLPPMNDSVN